MYNKLPNWSTSSCFLDIDVQSSLYARTNDLELHYFSQTISLLSPNAGSEVVDGLMQVLWGILYIEQPDTQTMNNIVVSSVELIYCYAECLALHGKDGGRSSVAPAVSLFKKLLFSTNEAVQTSSRYIEYLDLKNFCIQAYDVSIFII